MSLPGPRPRLTTQGRAKTLLLFSSLVLACGPSGPKTGADECRPGVTVSDACVLANQDCDELDCNGTPATCGPCDVDHKCVNKRCIHQ